MKSIDIKYKRLFPYYIKLNSLMVGDFTFNDDYENNSYEVIWKKHNRFTFCLYRNESSMPSSISCKINVGGKESTTSYFVSSEIERRIERWFEKIKEQISYESEIISQKEWSQYLNSVSINFGRIYNQAELAELNNLDEICGMGFRKAFEFLIKDYLIFTERMSLTEAQNEYKLQNCISKLNEDNIINKLATYTAYLGNDFSHYYRKRDDLEIKHLKEMINVLAEWITNKLEFDEKNSILTKKSREINKNFEN